MKKIVAYKDDLLAFCTVCDDGFNIADVDPKSVTESDRGILKMIIWVLSALFFGCTGLLR